jgi:retron-type reverse transcriptase
MKSNIALLRLMDLPVFSGKDELASLMHIRPGVIAAFSSYPNKFYKRYTIPKADGRPREIRQPRRDLKGVQSWILRNILDKLATSTYATAYIHKKNIADNVLPHSNSRYFVCLDLEDFFPSISVMRVAKIFSLIGYSKGGSSTLARLCTCRNNLPQGAVTSPSLSNLIAAKLDRRIAGYCSKRNIAYTRYADDITLSSNNPVVLHKSLPRIIKIIKSEHFKLNMSKLRVLGPRRRCLVTGLVKNNSAPKFGIGKRKKRQMRAIMHHCVLGLDSDAKYGDESSIIGWLSYLRSVDDASYRQMSSYFGRLRQKFSAT